MHELGSFRSPACQCTQEMHLHKEGHVTIRIGGQVLNAARLQVLLHSTKMIANSVGLDWRSECRKHERCSGKYGDYRQYFSDFGSLLPLPQHSLWQFREPAALGPAEERC